MLALSPWLGVSDACLTCVLVSACTLNGTSFLRSIVGLVAFTIPYSVWMAYVEGTHEHHGSKVIYPHMKTRAKKFPWANSDCDFFDSECHAEAKKAAAQ